MSYFKYNNYNIYYNVCGEGKPLVIIHGDTASSKMISGEAKFYSKHFKVIILDLIGQGKSKRVEQLPVNYWGVNSELIIELCKSLGLKDVNLLGTSGGAIVALNAVLKEPGLFNKVIADSFIGENITVDSAEEISYEREKSKQKLSSRLFWFMMHGSDWRQVIDQSTKMLLDFAEVNGAFFGDNLNKISNQVMLTCSKGDKMIPDSSYIMETISKKIKNSKLIIFEKGNHPAMLSNKKEFRKLVLDFLGE
ncbi:MAG: alpha/beta fold hydrolase [Clostridium sp.]